MNDSPRYLTYAANLSVQGVYFDKLNFWYISYVFFVYFCKLIGSDNFIIILCQYLLGYAAMLAVFFSTKRLSASVNTGFLAGIIFILFPDNLLWQSYVLTESFYRSVICIVFYLAVLVSVKKHRNWSYLLLAVGLLVCFFSKPTSSALFIALAVPFVWNYLKRPRYRWWKISAVVVTTFLLMVLANKIISAHAVMLIYEKGDIIFAMHEASERHYHESMTVPVPHDLVKSPADQPILQKMASFVYSNPWFFAKLMFGKIVMYLSHVRPFWSWVHNISMIVFLWPSYYFAYRAIKKGLVSDYLKKASIAYFILHTTIISITWVDWDGRFFLPLLPVIIVLGSIGMTDWIRGLKRIN